MVSRRSLLPAVLVALGTTACAVPDPTDGFDRSAMLRSVTDRVLLPTWEAVRDSAEALRTTSEAYASARRDAAPDLDARRDEARDAWRAAMTAWQRAEVMQIGPLEGTDMIGGQAIRDAIYSWPTVNPCRVDQEIVAGRYGEPGFFDDALVNVYGLDALEYLLFYEGRDNSCAPQIPINDEGTWDALSDDELALRRADYAAAAAARLTADAERLVRAWSADGEDFASILKGAGEPGSPYSTARDAVDELFEALYYVELTVKDDKLALPMGLDPDCAAPPCLDELESPWAAYSLANIQANLDGAMLLFVGDDPGTAVAFDDFLTELGATHLAETMIERLNAAEASAAAVPGSLTEALNDDPDAVRALYDDIKAFTDELKSSFITVLNLRVPQEGAGDND